MIDSQLASALEHARASGMPDLCELPPEAARGLYRVLTADELPALDLPYETRQFDGPASRLGLRIYRAAADAPGVILYFHGGGFVLGDLDCYHTLCSHLCARSGCHVVIASYRLAPESPFPAAVDDSYAALEWLAAHCVSEFARPLPIAVAGDSAGGNLAAVVSLLARERKGPAIALQALCYPVTAARPGMFPSHDKFNGIVLSAATMQSFHQHYFGSADATSDFRGAPLLASDLSGLPPALVQVAGYDPLHDEGVAYAQAMFAAKVKVSLVDYPGLIHGYLNMAGKSPTANAALTDLALALRAALAAQATPQHFNPTRT
ncbi:alpha/beta hydrolase [Uliginosibacterium sediminicola]|uniref:Alpha/beta hydrolase n=1 Tax=Uliginosibacterium sediminicola TaxID=2024550 RepID=A0ABU9YZU2_9RHOO